MLEITVDYIIVRGSMGVGKTATCKQLFQYLHSVEVPRAFIPFDVVRRFSSDRKPTYKNKKLCAKNIISLANNFIEEGYFTVIEGVHAEQDLLDLFKTQIRGDYKLFRLYCDKEICYERDKTQERPFACGKNNIDIAYKFFEDNIKNNPEEIVIDNSNLTVDEVVKEISKSLGWDI